MKPMSSPLWLTFGLSLLALNCSDGSRNDRGGVGGSRSPGTTGGDTSVGESVGGHGGVGNGEIGGDTGNTAGDVAGQAGASSVVVNPCNAEEVAALAAAKSFTADDPKFKYVGRVDFTDPAKPQYGAAGVTVVGKFRGSSLTVHLTDKNGSMRNYYDIVVDEQVVKLTPMVTAKDTYPITFPVPLACGDHSFKIVKRTEASIGKTIFYGIDVGTLLEPDPLPARKIEVIGDSITCGTGAEPSASDVNTCTADGWGQPTNNARLAWGSALGELLSAQVYNTCVSGIGLTRNYENDTLAIPMPIAYDRLSPVSRRTTDWDTAMPWLVPGELPKYVPDAIVIALGTNDFSPGNTSAPNYRAKLDPQTFADAYIAFIAQLRGYYRDAAIYYTDSPILGDGFPDATYKSKTAFEAALLLLDQYYAGLPESRVKKALGGKQSAYGCSGHPLAAAHRKVAENIAKVIRVDLGW